jgi:hypothetical protein
VNDAEKVKRPGQSKYPLRLDDALKVQLRTMAKRRGTTQRALIEEAIRMLVVADSAAQNDADLAPLISNLIQDQHRVLGKGFRSLMVRVGYEVVRMQYVLYEFMTQAGIPGSKIATWREEGWRFAVREFRQKPDDLDSSGDTGATC